MADKGPWDSVLQFSRHLVAALIALGTIVGAVFAAQQFDQGWIIVAAAVAAVVYATFRTLGSRIANFIAGGRNYPRVLERSVRLEEHLKMSQALVEEFEVKASLAYASGLAEGAARCKGAVLSTYGSPVKPSGMAMEGFLTVFVEKVNDDDHDIEIGTRYEVVADRTGECKGVVEVVAVGDLTKLKCVVPKSPGFWNSLVERAAVETDFPTGYSLHPTNLRTSYEDVADDYVLEDQE